MIDHLSAAAGAVGALAPRAPSKTIQLQYDAARRLRELEEAPATGRWPPLAPLMWDLKRLMEAMRSRLQPEVIRDGVREHIHLAPETGLDYLAIELEARRFPDKSAPPGPDGRLPYLEAFLLIGRIRPTMLERALHRQQGEVQSTLLDAIERHARRRVHPDAAPWDGELWRYALYPEQLGRPEGELYGYRHGTYLPLLYQRLLERQPHPMVVYAEHRLVLPDELYEMWNRYAEGELLTAEEWADKAQGLSAVVEAATSGRASAAPGRQSGITTRRHVAVAERLEEAIRALLASDLVGTVVEMVARLTALEHERDGAAEQLVQRHDALAREGRVGGAPIDQVPLAVAAAWALMGCPLLPPLREQALETSRDQEANAAAARSDHATWTRATLLADELRRFVYRLCAAVPDGVHTAFAPDPLAPGTAVCPRCGERVSAPSQDQASLGVTRGGEDVPRRLASPSAFLLDS